MRQLAGRGEFVFVNPMADFGEKQGEENYDQFGNSQEKVKIVVLNFL